MKKLIYHFVFTTMLFYIGSVHSGIISYRTTVTADFSIFPNDIAVGDQFILDFSIDDSISANRVLQPINTEYTSALFRDAITNLSLTRVPSNKGSWDPVFGINSRSSITIFDEVQTIDGTDTFDIFSISGVASSGYPSASDGSAFRAFGISATGPKELFGHLSDQKSLQEIANGKFDLNFFTGEKRSRFRFDPLDIANGEVAGTYGNIVAIPLPSTVWLFLLAASLLGAHAYRSRKSLSVPAKKP